jgi:hypothetical protein
VSAAAGVYKSAQGRIWRVLEANDGQLSVQVFQEGEWVPGPIRMVGLRLSPGTKKLSAQAIAKLPA